MQHWYSPAIALGAIALGASAFGQDPAPAQPPTAPSVVSSHQIDRYQAIKQLNESLKADPNNLADWIILGELAQEVAVEGPTDQAPGYFRLARQAYESALKLSPDNTGLKAAAQFARDQEANADQFNTSRQQVTTSYLETRRREVGQGGQPVPTLRVYQNPTVAPATGDAAQGQPAYPYGAPAYRPYATNEGPPYTYQQYQNGFFGPNALPVSPNALGDANALDNANVAGNRLNNANRPNNANPAINPNAANNQPMTLRQYTQQLPGVLGNEAVRRIAPGAATNPAGGAARGAAGGAAVPPR